MIYSLQNLTQTVDCDVLLSRAQKRKADLNHKRYSEEGLTVKYGETSAEVEASLQVILAEIAAEKTIIVTLPDGPTKEEHIYKKKQLEYKQLVLEHRKESYGAVALLEQEMDLGILDQEIVEVSAFIDAVTTRKQELAA
ncbi:hypothetical protein [Flavobacterium sp.]|uniref:hypothetical protein n=1 Tax=Flavobacterium sp. TaxID=239 RepID=UPI0025CBC279|nr:hypothetical protein [Flavobacterium sp.]